MIQRQFCRLKSLRAVLTPKPVPHEDPKSLLAAFATTLSQIDVAS
jgi:hypothetical protein